MKATLNGLGARRFFKTQDIDAAVIQKKKRFDIKRFVFLKIKKKKKKLLAKKKESNYIIYSEKKYVFI